ncbi:uncharacterized protein LOC129248947 [Anastrepha obliqua]|uniref:uncharacterized protein LOC129248947 n=1 Tax=Anastrepha obliqua TaxID=95512 RepID=UPI0024094867|nr:uncharacterized protein LOC129248947 [Anastrepha obliqua]
MYATVPLTRYPTHLSLQSSISLSLIISTELSVLFVVRIHASTSTYKKALDPAFNAEYSTLGGLTSICLHCNAKHFKCEKGRNEFLTCCHGGKVQIPIPRVPDFLERVFENNLNSFRSHYLENIRQINSSFAFASFEAKIVEPPGRGPYCFRIHGSIYHRVSPLHANNDSNSLYAQLYILDTDQATDIRLQRNANCDSSLVKCLHEMISTVNPLARQYKFMAQVEREEEQRARQANRVPHKVSMIFFSSHANRRYNLPNCSEIAAVFTTEDGEPPARRDLRVFSHSSETQYCTTISTLHRLCDPLVYPLLFPYGEPGYDEALLHEQEYKTSRRFRVTQLQFVGYRMAIREGFSLLHASGKLWQQYLVDQYVRIEGARLAFLRNHQHQLRVETYAGLHDYVMRQAELENARPGRIVVLPSSFPGSPRNMNMHYQDAMAIVRKHGKPSLFITFTSNPKWP